MIAPAVAFQGSTLTLHFGKVSHSPTRPADSSASGYQSWIRSNLKIPFYSASQSHWRTTQRKVVTKLHSLACSLEEATFVTYRPLDTQGWEYRLSTSPKCSRWFLAASSRASTQETDRVECVCSSASQRRLKLEWRSKRKFCSQQNLLGPWNMPYFDLTGQKQFFGCKCWLGCSEVRWKGVRCALYWTTRLVQIFESIWFRLPDT